MSNIPENLLYTDDHEWILKESEQCFSVGITDYAQDSLGDVTFVEVPEVGTELSKGDVFGVVESVKAASDLFMPVSGEIVEVNEDLNDSPELINDAPYEGGWIIKVKISDTDQSHLLSPDEYFKVTGSAS
ncbi:MAG: glycine cleavage system protein H [Opitutae bacterium]|nr:glycine cleavage system protein H [Opitutae bacterium]|tara:strand:+ start:1095 stop:1484 length:390 start_codon:yes stop_codon:yes gene_type:complete